MVALEARFESDSDAESAAVRGGEATKDVFYHVAARESRRVYLWKKKRILAALTGFASCSRAGGVG